MVHRRHRQVRVCVGGFLGFRGSLAWLAQACKAKDEPCPTLGQKMAQIWFNSGKVHMQAVAKKQPFNDQISTMVKK